ncbi:MAG: DUF58 domain-containing protein [Pseudomonadota bacterium]
MASDQALRAEADALSRALPDVMLQSDASEAAHVGSAGRRRAGSGEHFWQYRRYADEDSADRIDWRRSAKGDQLFVRETELETARTILCWCDPDPGFHWTSDTAHHTKADTARLILTAIGASLSKDGERIGVLGGTRKPAFGKRAVDRLFEDLAAADDTFPGPPRDPATLIIASDFYDPLETWRSRLAPLAAKCRDGVLIAIADPMEIDFPYSGRIKLSRPGQALSRILGRAESVREDYLARFSAQRAALDGLAAKFGWRLVEHSTAAPPIKAASQLQRQLASLGAKP